MKRTVFKHPLIKLMISGIKI